jgi:hypothetical protein
LESLAQRARKEPFFLASVLEAYTQGEGLDDAGLAAALGCRVGDLLMLRLCRAPRTDAEGFRADVECIRERFGLAAEPLYRIVKRGRVLARMQAEAGAGFFMAARDREEAEEKPTS